MEKFRIAQYGFIQMVALAYGMICSGLAEKFRRVAEAQDLSSPGPYRIIYFYHDYGIFLSLIIIAWAVICAYHSSIFSSWDIDERKIVVSGLALTALFLIFGTGLFLFGIVAIVYQ